VGGNVEVIAASAVGIDGALLGGGGSTKGMVTEKIDPSFSIPAPSISAATNGWIVSVSIDRGTAAIGRSPILVDKSYTTPAGTAVKLELAGATDPAGPFDTWVDTSPGAPHPLDQLKQARYFRYRLTLQGRAFDTPVVDFFDIDLAPH
jgi:hypothetical protein